MARFSLSPPLSLALRYGLHQEFFAYVLLIYVDQSSCSVPHRIMYLSVKGETAYYGIETLVSSGKREVIR